MYSFSDLGLLILFSFSIVVVYFLYEKFLELSAFRFLRYNNYILSAAGGMIFGALTILGNFMIKSISPDFTIPLFLVVSIVLIMVKDPATSLFSIFIPLIYYLVQHEDLFIPLMNITTLGISLFAYTVLSFKFKDANWYTLILISIISITNLLILDFVNGNSYDRMMFENTLFIPISIFIVYYPLRVAIRFSISASILFESVNYVYGSYIRHSLIDSSFERYLKKQFVKKGYFVIFEITTMGPKDYGNINEVRETVLEKIEKNFQDDEILFQVTEDIYGIFIATEDKIDIHKMILENDSETRTNTLQELSEFFKSISSSYISSSKNILSVDIKSGVSIYGVQSSSIRKLEEYAIFALRNINVGNINVFDNSIYRKRVSDSNMVNDLDSAIDLNTFDIKPIVLSNGENDIKYIDIIKKDDNLHKESVRELMKIVNWSETFDRYFGAIAIEKYSGNIMINYSPISQNRFDFEFLIENIRKSKTNISNVVFVVEDISKLDMKKINKYNIRVGEIKRDEENYPSVITEINKDNVQTKYLFVENENETKNDIHNYFIKN